MIKKFPFSDSILKDLGIINPEQVCSYSFRTIETLAVASEIEVVRLGLVAQSRAFYFKGRHAP